MEYTTISENLYFELRQYKDEKSFWLYWLGVPIKHLTDNEITELRAVLNVPILPGEL